MSSRTGKRSQHILLETTFPSGQETRRTSAAGTTTVSYVGAAYARRMHAPLARETRERKTARDLRGMS
jgi:hypothetical protein